MALKTINIPGHAYFVTSKVYKNKNVFVYKKFCEIIIDTLKYVREQGKLKLLGYVIMPDHLHLIVWPQGEKYISDIMRDFKKYASRQIIKYMIKSEKRGSPDPRGFVWRDQEIPPSRETKIIPYPTFSSLLTVFTVNSKKQTFKVWQSRNWIENVYSEKFLCQKLNYIHNNPVRAKIVKEADGYQYSSFRSYYQNDDSVINIDRI